MQNNEIGLFSNGKKNNYDFIRFIAATLVMFSHSYPLSGKETELFVRLSQGQETFGGLGVAIFFIISGYLVSQSYENSVNIGIFLRKRMLRIFPGLFVVIMLSSFVLGPMVTTLPIGEYFQDKLTYRYLTTASLWTIYYQLPGVFQSNIYSGAVNGSLWSLPFEFSFYLIVMGLGFTRILENRFLSTALFLLLCVLAPIAGLGFKLFVYFSTGMMFYIYRNYIPLDGTYMTICTIIIISSIYMGKGYKQVFPFCGAYMIFWTVYNPNIKLHGFARYGDFSYGMYIYAFPIQQLVTYLWGGTMIPWQHFIISFGIVFICAAFSWHIVEKPVMRKLK
jgi:peptidoglycan/LPS O-acetylase OafA/YrhL